MSTFQSFEDIEAWQKARELTRRIYELSDQVGYQRYQIQGRVANLKLKT